MTYTVTSSENITAQAKYDWVEVDKNNATIQQSTVSHGGSYSRRPGYLTISDFLDILNHAFITEYGQGGDDYPWHPGDLYLNMDTVLHTVCNTLSALVDIDCKRPIRDVKDI
jgi:hypothetical protein